MNALPPLGWLSRQSSFPPEEFDGFAYELNSFGDEKAFRYLTSYHNVAGLLQGHSHVLRHALRTKWYISEIEDVLRSSLFLQTKLVIEPPVTSIADVTEQGGCTDGEASYGYDFFTPGTLAKIFDHFGTMISGNDVLIVPRLYMDGGSDSPDTDEDSHTPYAYTDFFNAVSEPWIALASTERVQGIPADIVADSSTELGLPYLAGGNIKDLISLRKNEHEAFTQWRRFITEVLSAKNFTNAELYDALSQGIGELSTQIATAQRKGLLDAIGVTAIFSGLGVGVYQQEVGHWSAAIGLVGGTAAALKALLEKKDSYGSYSNNPHYFGWLARRTQTR